MALHVNGKLNDVKNIQKTFTIGLRLLILHPLKPKSQKILTVSVIFVKM